MIIIDSTTLIYFNKIGLGWVFKEFEIVIPESVFNEVVTLGKEKYKYDASIAENLIKENSIKVIKVKNGLKKELEAFGNLGKGEIDTLCLARENGGIAIIDESSAISIGKLFGIEVHGSFYLIFCLMSKKKIAKSEAKNILSKLVNAGWYCSTDVYNTILEKIEET